jgi:hypothetical protein
LASGSVAKRLSPAHTFGTRDRSQIVPQSQSQSVIQTERERCGFTVLLIKLTVLPPPALVVDWVVFTEPAALS